MGLIFYFGKCFADYGGHHLQNEHGRIIYDQHLPHDFPCRPSILDGGLLPLKLPEEQGRAELIHLNGWTILTFWDRSGDKRGQSNSAFVMCGHWDFAQVMKVAKSRYPKVFERIDFNIYQRFPA